MMKLTTSIFRTLVIGFATTCGSVFAAEPGIDPTRMANSIPLTELAVQNLGIQTVEAVRRDFETTVFAIGRIEDIPANRSVLSSRIAGRIHEVSVTVGDRVESGQVLAVVESRQPGNPPPRIPLKATSLGVVVESHIRPGQPVEPANKLLDVVDRSEMWAVAKIPEQEASKIVPGTRARITIPALGGELIEAGLERYGISADRQAGSIEGIFRLPNLEGRLLPGMRVEFAIITGSRENILSVPRESVQGDPTSRVVYVKDFELPNVFVKAPVQTGEKNDQHIEIVRGLFLGDEVVTTGAYALGYAGGNTGLSLKEVLDAAHGHEHNEDGSEITPEQKAAKKAEEKAAAGGDRGAGKYQKLLVIYGAVATLLWLAFAQMWWRARGRLAKS